MKVKTSVRIERRAEDGTLIDEQSFEYVESGIVQGFTDQDQLDFSNRAAWPAMETKETPDK